MDEYVGITANYMTNDNLLKKFKLLDWLQEDLKM